MPKATIEANTSAAPLAERIQAWGVTVRTLTVRHDRHAAVVLAFLHLACTLICLRFLARAEAQAD